jgi:hypothetical protein
VATNREILRIDGESVYRVPPLDVPALGQAAPDCIMQYSAVELFVARTKALNAGFSPHADDLASIATICRRLDGIQLAIAFAAARAAVLSVQGVAASCAIASRCRRPAAAPRFRGSGHRARRSIGAMNCCRKQSGGCCSGWPSSPADSPSRSLPPSVRCTPETVRILRKTVTDPVGIHGSAVTWHRSATQPSSTSEHIGHWIKMRRSLARFSALVSSVHAPSWADFITATPVQPILPSDLL